MQSPPFPRYLVPPRYKYSPQHLVLKHPQLPFLPQSQRPSFTHIKNNRQNYSSIYEVCPVVGINYVGQKINYIIVEYISNNYHRRIPSATAFVEVRHYITP